MKHIRSILLALLAASSYPLISGAGEGDPPGEIGDIGYQESYYLGGGWGPVPGVWRPGHAGLFVGGTLDGSMRFIESNVESAYAIKAIYEHTLSDWTSPHYDSHPGEDMDYMGAKTHNPMPTPAQRMEICSYAMAKLDLPISYFDGNGQNPKGQYTHPSADDLTSAGYANEQEYINDDIWLYDNYNEFWCVGFCERAYEHAGLNPTTDESDNWHFFLFTVPMQWNGENVQWASAAPPRVLSKAYSTARNTDVVVTFEGDNFASTAFAGNVSVAGSSSGSHGASLTYNASTYQLTINPTTDFSYGETVTVTLTTGIKDLANNALDGDGNGTTGPNHVFSFTIRSSPEPTPGPIITSLSPATLTGLPLPESQRITIFGSGFTSATRLTFHDGKTAYPDRVPAAITPTTLAYNIVVGPNAATWTVKAVDGGLESNPFYFNVTAAGGPTPTGLLLYEGFDYAAPHPTPANIYNDESLLGKNGGAGWSGAWVLGPEGTKSLGITDQISLSYGALLTSGNAAVGSLSSGWGISHDESLRTYNPALFSIENGKTYWISYLVRYKDLVEAGPTWRWGGIKFTGKNVGDVFDDLWFGKNYDSANWGMETPRVSNSSVPVTTGTHLVIAKIEYTGGVQNKYLWIDPSSSTLSGPDLATGSAIHAIIGQPKTAFSGIMIIGYTQEAVIDEIRVGTSYASVTPTGSQLTVMFNAQGGTTPNPTSIIVTNGLPYGPLPTTSREGYTFSGWWTAPGGTGMKVKSSTMVSIESTQTLYANFITSGGPTPTGLLLYEGFDYAAPHPTPANIYSDDSLVGKNGGTGWSGAWGLGPNSGVQSLGITDQVSLSYGALSISGNAAVGSLSLGWGSPHDESLRTYNPALFNIEDGKTYWISYLVRYKDLVEASPLWRWGGIKFNTPDLWFGKNATSANWGMETPSPSNSSIPVTTGTHLVIAKIEYTSGIQNKYLWIDPSTSTLGGTDLATGSAILAITGQPKTAFSGNMTIAYAQEAVIDEIRVGTSYAFVTPTGSMLQYNLTYTAGANGSISGTSPQTVNHDADGTTVTAVADTGYHFVNWSDGSVQNPRRDRDVTGNIAVTANFAINQYTLTYTAGANGSISGTSSQTVNYDADGTTVTAASNSGYHFVNWSDGSVQNPRRDRDVTGNITVTANFEINQYTLNYTAGAGGTISGTTPQTVNHGGNGTTVTAAPNTGYHFVNWSDGSTATARTDLNVTGDVAVTANFAINQYTLTYTASAGGMVTGTTPQTVNHGANGTTVTAAPNTGYHFVNWSDGSTATARTDLNVTGDVAVTANFALRQALSIAKENGQFIVSWDVSDTEWALEQGPDWTQIPSAEYTTNGIRVFYITPGTNSMRWFRLSKP